MRRPRRSESGSSCRPAGSNDAVKGFLAGEDPAAAPILDLPGLRCLAASPQTLLALKVLADPTLPMKLRQGITLEVFGQDGISVAPVKPGEREAWRQKLSGLLGDFGVEWSWSSVGEYLARVAAEAGIPRLGVLSQPGGGDREDSG